MVIALLYYDHMLTFPDEIKLIWCQRFSVISLLFVINRYLAFVCYIPVLVFILNAPSSIEE